MPLASSFASSFFHMRVFVFAAVAAAILVRPSRCDAQDTAPSTASVAPHMEHFVEASVSPGDVPLSGATVLLDLTIDTSGHVSEASAIESAGLVLDQGAIAAAYRFDFSPALVDGQPVVAHIRYRYRYPPPPPPVHPRAVVRGQIRDTDDHPVPAAVVTVQPDPSGNPVQRTDAAGAFRFELSTMGDTSIRVSASGYFDFVARERISNGDDVQVTYRLSALPRGALGTPVSAEAAEQGVVVRTVRPAREITRTTLDREEMIRTPGTLGDALRSVQNLPGVARAPFVSGSLMVRGSSPIDSVVYVDGMPLPALYHFGALGSTIQTAMIDRIDFYPSNYSADFGRATGGALDVGLRQPRTEGAHAAASLGLLDATAYVDGAITPTLSATIGARYAWLGYLITPITTLVTGIGVNIGYWDYQAQIDWHPRSSDSVRLLLIGDSDSLGVNSGSGTNASTTGVSQGFHLAQIRWTHVFGPGTQATMAIFGGWEGMQYQSIQSFGWQKTQLQSVPFGTRAEISHRFFPALRIYAGLDALFGSRDFSQGSHSNPIPQPGGGTIPALQPDTSNGSSTFVVQPGLYVEAEVTMPHGLHILPGFRVDYDRTNGQLLPSPRIAARWQFLPDWLIKAGVGRYVQPPVTQALTIPTDLLLVQTPLASPNRLDWQGAFQAAVGIEHHFTPDISLSVEGFYKWLDHVMVGFPSFDLAIAGEQLPPSTGLTSNGVGRAYGLEVLLRHRFNRHFFGWIAYTLSRSERRDGPTDPWRPFEFDQTHNFIAVASYEIGWGINVGLRFRYVTGRPTAQPVVAFDASTGQYATLSSTLWATRVPDFHQLDLRIERTWRTAFGSLTAFLEVLNVYNQTNAESWTFTPDGTQRVPSGVYVPIFPNLGLRGEI